MKSTVLKWVSFLMLAAVLLTMAGTVMANDYYDPTKIEVVSGREMGGIGEIESFYKERFDSMCIKYADQLSEQEKYCSYSVFDAIDTIDYRLDDTIPSRERIYNIATADDLHKILTGFYDSRDPSYDSDDKIKKRLEDILSVCGLNMDDYYWSVIRNIPGNPYPITKPNWTCCFSLKATDPAESRIDIEIVLHGDDMKVGELRLEGTAQP